MQFAPTLYKGFLESMDGDKNDPTQGIDIYEEEFDLYCMSKTISEFIFVLDRSGSMSGGSINKAKEALKFFLKSLPQKSRFNIVSFGSSFKKMFKKPIEYSPKNIAIALAEVSTFKADLGGTEILTPLNAIFQQKPFKNYQRNIFLLTDGAVGNQEAIFKLISKSCIYNNQRIFSIGIGSGCSESLVRKTAQLGGGSSIFISNEEDMGEKIINLLNDSISPSLTDFSVTFDPKYIACIGNMPQKESHVLRGQPFRMYALLKNDIEEKIDLMTTITIEFYDTVSETHEKRVFNLSLEGSISNNSFHQMCIKKMVDSKKYNKNDYYLDPKLQKVSSIDTKMCVAYQVLHPEHTAFICVVKENDSIFKPMWIDELQ